MIIKTNYHGEMDINEQQILHFEHGLPGFLDEKQFVLLGLTDEESPYIVLQSVTTPELAFIVTSPFFFFEGYEFDLEPHIQEELEIEKIEDVEIMVILTVKEPFSDTTANLQAPLVVNRHKKKGRQVILNNTEYNTKHFILPQE